MKKIIAILILSLLIPSITFAKGQDRVMISFSNKPTSSEKGLLRILGLEIVHEYKNINAIAGIAKNKALIGYLPFVESISDDGIAYETLMTLPPEQMPEIKWNVQRIGSDKVWYLNEEVISIAILDTGIDTDHPELANSIIDCKSFVDYTTSCEDDRGHGTHVAGIITADYKRIETATIEMVGNAPDVKIDVNKVLTNEGWGYWSWVIAAIDETITEYDNELTRDQVISMSLGGTQAPKELGDIIKKAYQKGIVIVTSAGNEYDRVTYPGKYPEVIAVAASDFLDQIPDWSSSGREVELTAPGVGIYSTDLSSTYSSKSGTSMACPHISSAVAFLLVRDPSLTPDKLREVLKTTAEDLGYSKRDQGSGLVRVDSAIACIDNDYNCLGEEGNGGVPDCPPGMQKQGKC